MREETPSRKRFPPPRGLHNIEKSTEDALHWAAAFSPLCEGNVDAMDMMSIRCPDELECAGLRRKTPSMTSIPDDPFGEMQGFLRRALQKSK
jgi:hypothetical protein